MKNICILTSGGDCCGMNAVIYYASKYAFKMKKKFFICFDGFEGLYNNGIRETNYKNLSFCQKLGGTIIGTSRFSDFEKDEVQEQAVQNLKNLDIDTLIVLGGDGSFKGAKALSKKGINVYGIPCTIDNDMFFTDFTIGFHTAVEVCRYCINCFSTTMYSHNRIGIIETMGRHCGDIALYSGLVCDADIVLVPEINTTIEQIISKLEANIAKGKKNNIVVLSEGYMHANELKEKLEEYLFDVEIKSNVIGYIQRGGETCDDDLRLAEAFVRFVFNLMKKDISNRVVGIRDSKVMSFDFDEINKYYDHPGNQELYDLIYLTEVVNNGKTN